MGNKRMTIKKYNIYCKVISWLVIGLFASFTIVLYNLYLDPSFAEIFNQYTGLNLTQFTMSRNSIFELAMSEGGIFAGFGAVTELLESYAISGMTNLHNDVLMVYMDCGFVGMILFLALMTKVFKRNLTSLFLESFLLVELFTAHYLGSGGLVFFVCLYILKTFFDNDSKIKADDYLFLTTRSRDLVSNKTGFVLMN